MYLYVDCNIEKGNLIKLKRAKTDPSLESGPMRRGGSAGTSSAARRAKKGPVNLCRTPCP